MLFDLILQNNSLSGNLPSFGQLSLLNALDLSINQFSGSISTLNFNSNLTKLELLKLKSGY